LSEHLDTRAERLAAALDDFIRSSPDVEAAAVVSFDGLPMASALPEDLEEDRVGAMSAALLSLGEQAAMGLGRGQLNQVFVEGEHGFVFLMSARDQAVLAAIAARTAKIGFMLFEMRRAAERIGRALEAPVEPRVAAQVEAPAEDRAPSPPYAPPAAFETSTPSSPPPTAEQPWDRPEPAHEPWTAHQPDALDLVREASGQPPTAPRSDAWT
jgi:predicted regulator of Ras-like GTPase activity (Roadblock/LC7/MglB family)